MTRGTRRRTMPGNGRPWRRATRGFLCAGLIAGIPGAVTALGSGAAAAIGSKAAVPAVTAAGVAKPTIGYWLTSASGAVYPFGGQSAYGATGGGHSIVSIVATSDGTGYWLAAADGRVLPFGNAQFHGSKGGMWSASPVVGMAATVDEHGYWLVGRDGGIFTFGNAKYFGSEGAKRLNAPVVGMAATPDGKGYWLVASDGGIFTFGNAKFLGSEGAKRLNAPVVGMAATPDGKGYWLVASDGGIFTFGNAKFLGSEGAKRLNAPVVGMAATPDGKGYWLAASDGGIFTFGNAPFRGSTGGLLLPSPIVGLAVGQPAGTIDTLAGRHETSGPPTSGTQGDGGQADAATLDVPSSVAVAPDGTTYISLIGSHSNSVRAINGQGVINTIAGTGTAGTSPNGTLAKAAALSHPGPLATDAKGNLLIVDTNNNVVRMIPVATGSYYGQAMSAGHIYTIAGTGTSGSPTFGVVATSSNLRSLRGLALAQDGTVYLSDATDNVVAAISPTTGLLSKFVSATTPVTGTTTTALNGPGPLAVSPNGSVYIGELRGSGRILRASSGTLVDFYNGTGGPAAGLALDGGGSLLAAYPAVFEVARISLSTAKAVDVAGARSGSSTFGVGGKAGGDDGPALKATLVDLGPIAMDPHSNLYIVQAANASTNPPGLADYVLRSVSNEPAAPATTTFP